MLTSGIFHQISGLYIKLKEIIAENCSFWLIKNMTVKYIIITLVCSLMP